MKPRTILFAAILSAFAIPAFAAVQSGAQTYPADERAPTIDLNSASLTNGVLLAAQDRGDESQDKRAPKIDLNSASLGYGVLAAADKDQEWPWGDRAPKIDLNSA